jgi:hypothetical protein
VSDKVDGLANRVAESENKILLSIQESRIGTPQATLKKYYFDEKSSDSLMFFVKNPASATVDNKIAYSLNVIRTWGVRDDFNNIHTAIQGSLATPGIMDLFANLIVINNTDRPKSTVNDRYDAMQAYFNKLIGYQIELSTMIKGAYDTLVKADPSKLPAGFVVAPNAADQWTKQFQSDIQEEYQIYRAIVERIAVSRILNDPTGALYPARLDEQTQIMLGKLDNMMMWAFAEMTGLRVRVIVSPDMNPTNTYFVEFPDRPRILLPSTDSGLWTPVTATGLPAGVSPFYDSWRLRLADSLPEFTATNTWLLYRNAPLSIVGTTKVDVLDKRGLVRDKVPRGTAGGISVRTAYFDQNYREADVSAGGVLFGSVTVVRRASAKSMLSFCGIAATVTDNCATFVGASLQNCSTMNFSNTTCAQSRDSLRPPMHVRREQKFGYFGTAELNGTVTVSQTISPCTGVFSSVGKNQTSIYDNLNSALIFLSAGYVNTSLTANVTWKPGLSYVYTVDTIPAGCSGTVSYTAGLAITFPP